MIDAGINVARRVYTPYPVNRQHPLNRGRVAWWLTLPAISGGRQWFDLVGLSPGVLTNMGAGGGGWQGTVRPGGFGHLRFDGTNDNVVVAVPSRIVTGFSAFAWFYSDAGSTGFRVIGGGTYWYFAGNGASFDLYFETSTGTYNPVPAGLVRGAWNRLGVTWNGTTATFWLNGVSLASQARGGNFTMDVTIWGHATFPWLGALDDGSVYSRALSAAEVKADYDLSRLGYPGVLNRIGPSMLGGVDIPGPSGGFVLGGLGIHI